MPFAEKTKKSVFLQIHLPSPKYKLYSKDDKAGSIMSNELRTQIEQVRKEFIESLPKRAHHLEEIWGYLSYLNWSSHGVKALQQVLHRLAGTCSSFGFDELSKTAHSLDNYISELLSPDRSFGGVEHAHIAERVEQLAGLMRHAHVSPELNLPLSVLQAPTKNPAADGKVIFIIDPDHALAALLSAYLKKTGFIVEHFDTPKKCIERLETDLPNAILMDLDFEHNGLQALTLFQQINALITEHIPILLLSARTDVTAKLRALRAGCADYISKPLDFNHLIEKLMLLINQHEATYKVMIVDDEPLVADFQAEVLRYAGMEVICVDKPLLSLQRAVQFKPDLVILDMHMPDINGLELATLLRQEPQFLLLPIIFVTADTDVNLHNSIKAIGVNAIMLKPIESEALIQLCQQTLINTAFLKNRIAKITQRSKQPQQITRSYFFSAIETQLQNPSLSGGTNALYYISITNLEELNKQLGKVDLNELHEQFCQELSNLVGSEEQWVDLSNLVACMLAGNRSATFHEKRCEQMRNHLNNQLYKLGGNPYRLSFEISITPLTTALGNANNALMAAESALDLKLNNGAPRVYNRRLEDRIPHDQLPVLSDVFVDEKPATDKPKDFSKVDFEQDLRLVFQPIISLEKQAIDHFSVLTRLIRDDGEAVPAAQFLNRLMPPEKRVELDRWALQQATDAMINDSKIRENGTLFIHLAEETLQQNTFFSFVANVLRASRLRGDGRLIFMLDENWAANNLGHAIHIAHALSEIHCSICLIRAGEHPEILDIIDTLPMKYLRLSPSLTTTGGDEKLLGDIVKTCQKNNIQVIATHIEDSHNLSSLWMEGIRLFEGFFIQPPETNFHVENDIVFAKEFVQTGTFKI